MPSVVSDVDAVKEQIDINRETLAVETIGYTASGRRVLGCLYSRPKSISERHAIAEFLSFLDEPRG